jgi:hypothetical protein
MKLRIRGNSVRLRVSRAELTQIETQGCAEDSTEFAPTVRLTYRVEVRPDGAVEASYSGDTIEIRLPRGDVQRWAQTDQIGIRGEQRIADGGTLQILVEKDFACLSPTDEDQSDLFPNPGAGIC